MSFKNALNIINTELDKVQEDIDNKPKLSRAKESKAPESKDYRKLAEQAILVKHLKVKEDRTEKENAFIAQVEAVDLSDDDRAKVKEAIELVLDEAKKADKKKDKKEDKKKDKKADKKKDKKEDKDEDTD